MFLPMSCTSPFTVAITIRPCGFAPAAFSASMNGMQIGDRLFHDARALHDLRQKHFPGAEQIADHAHARP